LNDSASPLQSRQRRHHRGYHKRKRSTCGISHPIHWVKGHLLERATSTE